MIQVVLKMTTSKKVRIFAFEHRRCAEKYFSQCDDTNLNISPKVKREIHCDIVTFGKQKNPNHSFSFTYKY